MIALCMINDFQFNNFKVAEALCVIWQLPISIVSKPFVVLSPIRHSRHFPLKMNSILSCFTDVSAAGKSDVSHLHTCPKLSAVSALYSDRVEDRRRFAYFGRWKSGHIWHLQLYIESDILIWDNTSWQNLVCQQ